MIVKMFFIAQAESTADSIVGAQTWGGGGYTALMLLLLLMLSLLVGVFIFFKKMGLPNIKKTGELELLETRPLGGRQFIVVGRYRGERFLLGICPGRIDFLCRLKSDDSEASTMMDEFSMESLDES